MVELAKLLFVVLIAGDAIWRVARIMNGEPASTAWPSTPRLQLIVILALAATLFGLLMIDAGIPGKISCGILCGSSVLTLILVLIFGGLDEPPVKPPALTPDAASDSNPPPAQ